MFGCFSATEDSTSSEDDPYEGRRRFCWTLFVYAKSKFHHSLD